jgi:spore maturation protein CgeB
MHIVMFYHSLRSDWNHGNAHFLRGVASELIARGHDVRILEPRDAWSAENLIAERGADALEGYRAAYPQLDSTTYDESRLDLDAVLDGADAVIVHEWSSHGLVARIGEHRATRGGYALLFHDTHHRAATDPRSMSAYDLREYDGVLAYGQTIRDLYLRRGWAEQVFVWHEAADTRVFHPIDAPRAADLVWIGNWGDDERTAELEEFLVEPARALALRGNVYGVRYPDGAKRTLADAGLAYHGWLPNYEAPAVFARHRFTVHIPRRPYVRALPGIPTIRPFEALACGIPLISAPWDDVEHLFTPGEDYLVARNGDEMRRHMRAVLNDPDLARSLAVHGLRTIRARHTCAHRVDELLSIVARLAPASIEDTTTV